MTVMDNDDPALPETTEGEAWYDTEIAPALAALAKRCHERGMLADRLDDVLQHLAAEKRGHEHYMGEWSEVCNENQELLNTIERLQLRRSVESNAGRRAWGLTCRMSGVTERSGDTSARWAG